MMIPTAVLATAALTMTACSSGSSTGAAATGGGSGSGSAPAASTAPVAPPAQPSNPTNPTNPTTTTGGAGSVTVTVTGSPSKQGGGVPACASSQLAVSQTDSGVGAGQLYTELVFTNTSATSCTLTGYPGVSYVAANGVQSGNPAQRSTGDPVATVTLKPHGTAEAQLHDSNGISGYDPSQCQLTPADGLRVYPPGQTAALFLPWKTQHCAGLSIHPLTIGPIKG